MDKKWPALSLTLIALTFIFNSTAANAYDKRLPAQISQKNYQFKRCSRGELKAFKFIHVGYAAVYQKNCENIKDIFSKTPKQIRFAYDREIPGRAFQEASDEYLKTNLGKQYQRWKKSIDDFNSGYKNIEEGDFYDLIYHPETGLLLHLNQVKLSVINDPDIGLAYFNIWFGEKPFSENLKESLLTPEKPIQEK